MFPPSWASQFQLEELLTSCPLFIVKFPRILHRLPQTSLRHSSIFLRSGVQTRLRSEEVLNRNSHLQGDFKNHLWLTYIGEGITAGGRLISRCKANLEAMGDGNDLPVEIKKQVLEESVLSLLRDSQYSTKDARNDSPKLAEAFAIFRICFLYVANCTSSSSSTLLGDACAIHWVQQARYKCGLRVISYRIQAAIEWRDDNLDLQFIRLPRGDFLCEPQRCQRLLTRNGHVVNSESASQYTFPQNRRTLT